MEVAKEQVLLRKRLLPDAIGQLNANCFLCLLPWHARIVTLSMGTNGGEATTGLALSVGIGGADLATLAVNANGVITAGLMDFTGGGTAAEIATGPQAYGNFGASTFPVGAPLTLLKASFIGNAPNVKNTVAWHHPVALRAKDIVLGLDERFDYTNQLLLRKNAIEEYEYGILYLRIDAVPTGGLSSMTANISYNLS